MKLDVFKIMKEAQFWLILTYLVIPNSFNQQKYKTRKNCEITLKIEKYVKAQQAKVHDSEIIEGWTVSHNTWERSVIFAFIL